MSKNTGGRAFPSDFGRNNFEAHKGMTLRDYFAAAAVQGSSANSELSSMTPRQLAKVAYEIADAMLEEREKDA